MEQKKKTTTATAQQIETKWKCVDGALLRSYTHLTQEKWTMKREREKNRHLSMKRKNRRRTRNSKIFGAHRALEKKPLK